MVATLRAYCHIWPFGEAVRREQEASGGRLTQEGNGFHLLTVKTRSCLLFIASQFYLKHLSKVAMILTFMMYILRGGDCLKTC